MKSRLALIGALLALSILPAHAASGFKGRGGGSERPPGAEEEIALRRGAIKASGLVAIFPAGVKCAPVASPYASPTRYDGSPRPLSARGGGLHGGIDLTLEEHTPLLAAADGAIHPAGSRVVWPVQCG